jgi:putative transposase
MLKNKQLLAAAGWRAGPGFGPERPKNSFFRNLFTRAEQTFSLRSRSKNKRLYPLLMSKPARNSVPNNIRAGIRTFFVTSKTNEGKALLQSERMATLFIDVLRSYVAQRQFVVHEFVVMRTHVHLLISIDERISIENAMQLIKGNFSYRAHKEFGLRGAIWQRGFSEVRIHDREDYLKRKNYIEQNPVEAGYVESAEKYPYCSLYLRRQKAAAKAAGRG